MLQSLFFSLDIKGLKMYNVRRKNMEINYAQI